MMDMYYPVVDRVQSLLAPEGIVGVCDFYVSGRSPPSNKSSSSHHNRHCNWLTRYFWQMWFDLDHIQLAPGRRDYLEYKFGTIKSLNRRNHFIIPYLIQIPYYVWLGCAKSSPSDATLLPLLEEDDGSSWTSSKSGTSSPTYTPHAALVMAYQQRRKEKQWRLDYDPDSPCHTQFRSYIYAFTWEDPRVDLEFLNLNKDDVLFVISSAGDNALEYALKGPKRIHCVDMNPCQVGIAKLKKKGGRGTKGLCGVECIGGV
jgi:betaine lipid synthase